MENDIAILKLKTCLDFDNDIGPACLPESSIHYKEIGVTSGWEMTDGNIKSTKAYHCIVLMSGPNICCTIQVYI